VVGNDIWIGTRGEGVWVFNTQTASWTRFNKVTEPFVNVLFKDNKGNILIGGANCGLLSYSSKDKNLTQYNHNEFDKFSLSSNSISSIYEDKQQNLWVGCVQNDLNYTSRRNPFHALKQSIFNTGELTQSNVSAVLEEDDNNTLWVGYYTVGGIDIINRKTYQKRHLQPKKSGLGEGSVQCIFKDSRSNVWIGTYLGGLQMYDKKNNRFITYLHNPADNRTISGNDIRKITEDKEGNLWIAVHGGGVNKFNPVTKQFQYFKVNYSNYQHTISSDWVFTVYCDKEDKIWVGSIEGISVIDKNATTVKKYNNQLKDIKSLSNNFVIAILQDSKGKMWFGTSYGLNLLDPENETFKSITTKDGLPNDNVTGILEDKSGNLWIATFKGLARYSPGDNTFKIFDTKDGLATDEFIEPASFKSKTGEMFFGGREGVISFFPEDVKKNTYKPPVYLTNFKLFNLSVEVLGSEKNKSLYLKKQITFTPDLTLSYNQNVFTFEFVALNFIRPEKNQYGYMMEGFDKQWNKIGSKNDVTYTNLPPGDYIFRVKASNNDGVWNETGTSLKLTITPPWWKTFWAYAIYSFLIILTLLFFRYTVLQRERLKRKMEMERMEASKTHEVDLMKLRFFTNISHEFRTPLTLILAPLEKPFHLLTPEKLKERYNLISRNASRLLRLINQLMDIRKLEAGGLKLEVSQGDIVHFVKDISQLFNYEANERNIEFKIISKLETLPVWFDSDKVDKILYNVIANSFKFTPNGKKITIYISLEKRNGLTEEGLSEFVEIIVEDSGIGIQPEELTKIFDRFYQAESPQKNIGTGLGLALTKELVELHQGEIIVESEYGKGSRFKIYLPVGKDHFANYQIVEKDSETSFTSIDLDISNDNLSNKSIENGKSKKLPLLPVMLVIEDHADLRLFIKHEFIGSFKIIEAIDGVQGYNDAIETMPDIIISDILMPEMNGIELSRKLKTDERTSHIPMILLTARSSEEQVIEGLDTGADDYITKPFSISVLRARVKNLIDSRIQLRKQFSKLPDISKAITTTTLDQKFLERASKLMDQHLSDSNFDAHVFASEIGMSRSQLYRKVQALTGYSVNEFIRNIRLKKAAELLLKSDNNVTQIAYLVGFKEVTYFVKCFASYYGTSPSKYRGLNKQ
jgi:signal transduction histidine kinase/DNA-binding response OmpR family regulator/streptogramin lyase